MSRFYKLKCFPCVPLRPLWLRSFSPPLTARPPLKMLHSKFMSAPDSIFVRACKSQPVDRTPVWFMRQAGRYMPEYRAVRKQHSLLEICKKPALAAEVTITAAEILGVDAAIIFADLLLPLEVMGLPFHFSAGEGPVIEKPVRSKEDVANLRTDRAADLGYVSESVSLVAKHFADRVPDYRRYVLPHVTGMVKQLQKPGPPIIYFGTDSATLLPAMKESGADVIGLDWRIPLDEGWTRLDHQCAVQGNLDPVLLFADWKELKPRAEDILRRAAGRPGHIFNLGHGILS